MSAKLKRVKSAICWLSAIFLLTLQGNAQADGLKDWSLGQDYEYYQSELKTLAPNSHYLFLDGISRILVSPGYEGFLLAIEKFINVDQFLIAHQFAEGDENPDEIPFRIFWLGFSNGECHLISADRNTVLKEETSKCSSLLFGGNVELLLEILPSQYARLSQLKSFVKIWGQVTGISWWDGNNLNRVFSVDGILFPEVRSNQDAQQFVENYIEHFGIEN